MSRNARLAVVLAALAAACARPATSTSSPTTGAAAGWAGVYDLVSIGHRDGPRPAIMTVVRSDSGYAMTIQGPPGRLLYQRFVGDSAYGGWLLVEGDSLVVAMRLVGDSVHGSSRGRTLTTRIEGRRRPAAR